ncbi:phosphodiester glycosidase family protein [Pseudarthrobacter sp. PS3-L1]|uniref:phosphodiester glycosidase family protein n=1 Tax=Pseudarthrobacter sp. PS3-L1 TaxID=3046207 RepID=UPI0024BA7715|nr:phosphodiester glycosidase family protein [Pseudarthrobacter sp. PS3-L1]MDJ0319936.1 phosphodiester glycosidase family protein [Pseudarthrobacter sp. PS3-L1]
MKEKTSRPRKTHRVRRIILIVSLSLSLVPLSSYAQALTYPGNASFADRTVGWLRDNGASGVVNTIENWYYTHHAPSAQAPPPDAIPKAGAAPIVIDPTLPNLRANTAPTPTLPNEGQWIPGPASSNAQPALYTSFVQPDTNYPSVIAGIALIRQSQTTAHLVAGTRQPDTGPWPGQARVPADDVAHLLATFNSGFKSKDITGGFYLNGQYSRDLIDGQASAVITADGRISIGAWNAGVQMSPEVTAVRQNLHLIVSKGTQVPDLSINAGGTWGSSRNQLQYTWRSGLGTDAHGNLIYVAGNGLTLETLATSLVRAGATTAMELDIHNGQVNFSSWASNATTSTPTELLPNMTTSPDRYLSPDQRDFFYLTVK